MGNSQKKGLDVLGFDELEAMPRFFECEAIPLGCSLVDRKIMEDVSFDYCKMIPVGEDIMWYGNACEKGYHALCINQEIDHLSNRISGDYYLDPRAMRVEFIMRVGDETCKNVDLMKLRSGKPQSA
jgi:hypothetical protein